MPVRFAILGSKWVSRVRGLHNAEINTEVELIFKVSNNFVSASFIACPFS